MQKQLNLMDNRTFYMHSILRMWNGKLLWTPVLINLKNGCGKDLTFCLSTKQPIPLLAEIIHMQTIQSGVQLCVC